MKVKIFSDWYIPRVEEGFNNWMAENFSKIEVVRVEHKSSGYDNKVHQTIVVFYKNAP